MANTEEMWRQRVASWRASGETAEAFSAGRGWSAKTLRWWSSRLGRTTSPPIFRVAQLVRESTTAGRNTIVIEQLDARVRITIEPGVDREVLSMVLDRFIAWTSR
jgi:hypothetical protein